MRNKWTPNISVNFKTIILVIPWWDGLMSSRNNSMCNQKNTGKEERWNNKTTSRNEDYGRYYEKYSIETLGNWITASEETFRFFKMKGKKPLQNNRMYKMSKKKLIAHWITMGEFRVII